jgi:hypothetical protein
MQWVSLWSVGTPGLYAGGAPTSLLLFFHHRELL